MAEVDLSKLAAGDEFKDALSSHMSSAVVPSRIVLPDWVSGGRDLGIHFSPVVVDDQRRLWRYNDDAQTLEMIFDPSSGGM